MVGASDPFTGPFRFDVGIESNPRLAEATRRRWRRLGQWVRQERWYVDGLLRPNAGEPGFHVSPIFGSRKSKPLLCAYLDRPLGEIVLTGSGDYNAVMQRIDAAVVFFMELLLDVSDDGRVICRQLTLKSRDGTGRLQSIPRISTDELIRRLVGFAEEQPVSPRRRPTEKLAEEAASVYLGARRHPAKAVAEHFGWRDPHCDWYIDPARARVRRVTRTAERLGFLPKSIERRRREMR